MTPLIESGNFVYKKLGDYTHTHTHTHSHTKSHMEAGMLPRNKIYGRGESCVIPPLPYLIIIPALIDNDDSYI